MGRKLTFPQLKSEKGWPYGRQHTHNLSVAGHFPRPHKAYEGALINVWDEDEIERTWRLVPNRATTPHRPPPEQGASPSGVGTNLAGNAEPGLTGSK